MAIVTDRISRNLLTLRKQMGLTQKQFADKLGTKQTTYAHWEKGGSVPDKDMWDLICSSTGKDVAWFYVDHTEPTEIITGPEVEAFRAFTKMLGAMGKSSANPVARILTGRTAKHMPAHSFLSKIKVAFG